MCVFRSPPDLACLPFATPGSEKSDDDEDTYDVGYGVQRSEQTLVVQKELEDKEALKTPMYSAGAAVVGQRPLAEMMDIWSKCTEFIGTCVAIP